MRKAHRLAGRFVSACLTMLVATAACAQDPLPPGFWSFPHEPHKSAADIDASCRTGFSANLGGGAWLSFLLEDGRWINDAREACTFDEGTNAHSCATTLWDGEKFAYHPTRIVYSTDAEGRLKAEASIDGGTVVSYPTPCPAEAVADSLAEALSPER